MYKEYCLNKKRSDPLIDSMLIVFSELSEISKS